MKLSDLSIYSGSLDSNLIDRLHKLRLNGNTSVHNIDVDNLIVEKRLKNLKEEIKSVVTLLLTVLHKSCRQIYYYEFAMEGLEVILPEQ